jgi:hypothetical protein
LPGEDEPLMGRARFARTRIVSASRGRLAFHLLLPRCASRKERDREARRSNEWNRVRARARPSDPWLFSLSGRRRWPRPRALVAGHLEVTPLTACPEGATGTPEDTEDTEGFVQPVRCVRCLRWFPFTLQIKRLPGKGRAPDGRGA